MDFFGDIGANLSLGFSQALTLNNLFYCFIGVLLGTAVGVLPGLGPIATIAMLLPITFKLEPISALIMLAGIYYGAQYGGSTTAILINLPGESGSVVTAIDGHQLAKKAKRDWRCLPRRWVRSSPEPSRPSSSSASHPSWRRSASNSRRPTISR
jgi:TctA family transporter